MPIAPLMLDLKGLEVDETERELLQHPLTGGVILFTRNFESQAQLQELVRQTREAANKDLLIAVDHEGGRVQRFRTDFTVLPPLASIGQRYTEEPEKALALAQQAGWLMARELRSVDIDFSFAPVLDLDYGVSTVIGNRSLHTEFAAVTTLARAYIQGMHQAGMAATGKHFPGHGAVEADSHIDIPVDPRSKNAVFEQDIQPFKALIAEKVLDAVMPAHVIYKEVDENPSGFSPLWLQQVLRGELGFEGVIFSDDLSMEGASVAGGYAERAEAAINAGCDMILACNNQDGAIDILDRANVQSDAKSAARLHTMLGKLPITRQTLLASREWQDAVEQVQTLV